MSVYGIDPYDWQRPGWSESKDDKDAPPLSTVATSCQKGIFDLLEAARSDDCCVKDILGVRNVEHIQERYDQWAGNLGALQHFRSPLSLVYRLRDSPLVRDSILGTLTDFLTSIQDATDIAAGIRPNRVVPPFNIGSDIDISEYDISSSESDASSVQSSGSGRNLSASTSEIHELISAMNIGLNSLFKASIFVRKFARTDKRQRMAKTKPFDNRADIMYVNDRYPAMAKKNPTLADRLGEANARRRQYFKYRRDHNERLSTVSSKQAVRHLSVTPQNQPGTTTGSTGPTESVFTAETKPSWFTETEATEFVADAAEQEKTFEMNEFTPARSVVSFATSIAETSDDEIPFPPVPDEARNGAPFLCPYCLKFQQFKVEGLERQWRKHVLQDLEPYSCTSPSCSLDSFQSQHAWFEHELLVHRCQWVCPECSDPFWLVDGLKAHISRHHSGSFSKTQLPAIIDQSKRPISSIQPNECPFCDDSWAETASTPGDNGEVLVVTPEQFRRHLGHHMQQVALFALPRLDQSQSRSVGSADANNGSTQSDMPAGFRWIRDDCGRGWSIISRKRVMFSSFAYFLKRYVPRTPAEYHKYLKNFIDRNLGTFGFTEEWIARRAYQAARMADDLQLEYNLRDEEVPKLIRLSIFDIFVFCDNSGSTNLDGSRQAQIQTVKSIIYWTTRIGMDGIYLRFLNSDQDTNGQFDRLTDPNTIDDLFEKIDIGGGVKLGTALDDKLFAPFVQDVANGRKRGELVKPRITMIVTESEPVGEEKGYLAMRMTASTMNEYLYEDTLMAQNYILSLLGDRDQAKKYFTGFCRGMSCKFEPRSGLVRVVNDLIQSEGEFGYTKYVMRLFISTMDVKADDGDRIRREFR